VVVSAWLAVDDADEENSCVGFIPGSHQRMLPHVAMGPEMWFKKGVDPDLVPREGIERMILRAGEFVLFNERCLHHSEPNRSDRRRFGLAIRQIPPLVRITSYDSEHHGVVQISGADPLGFNRHAAPRHDPL
ncbi:MAG: phytanoyl-CoA dioxygenase family protein, partial [Planctomycetota bacterium]